MLNNRIFRIITSTLILSSSALSVSKFSLLTRNTSVTDIHHGKVSVFIPRAEAGIFLKSSLIELNIVASAFQEDDVLLFGFDCDFFLDLKYVLVGLTRFDDRNFNLNKNLNMLKVSKYGFKTDLLIFLEPYYEYSNEYIELRASVRSGLSKATSNVVDLLVYELTLNLKSQILSNLTNDLLMRIGKTYSFKSARPLDFKAARKVFESFTISETRSFTDYYSLILKQNLQIADQQSNSFYLYLEEDFFFSYDFKNKEIPDIFARIAPGFLVQSRAIGGIVINVNARVTFQHNFNMHENNAFFALQVEIGYIYSH